MTTDTFPMEIRVAAYLGMRDEEIETLGNLASEPKRVSLLSFLIYIFDFLHNNSKKKNN